MKREISQAIAQVFARRGDGAVVAGSAFLVTDRHLLTAFHVVGARSISQRDGPLFHTNLTISFAALGLSDLQAHVAEGCFDPIADWALIELKDSITGVQPIPLGSISKDEFDRAKRLGKQLQFESYGFPAIARITRSGLTIDGRIQNPDDCYQDAWAFQLYSDNAAAAFGDVLSGLSGAPCLVDGAAVGVIRANLVAPDIDRTAQRRSIAAGVLYACPIATMTLQESCSKHFPVLDPIRGLPGLPHRQLPLEPFRYLRWYGAEHAEVFFGRSRRLRDLYLQVTNKDSPPVLLMYGSSGVGKSSLLEAGLLPRLSWHHVIRTQRREATKSLIQSFDERTHPV